MLSPTAAILPSPSGRLRLFARMARALLWLLLAFWVLVGISWALLHGWIVPRISEFRPRLEAAASQALGVPVRIGQLSASSVGLNPSFEFNEVTLLDGAGRPALRLPHVVVGLSPLAVSGWGIAQLVVEGAELDIRRNADGRLEIAGLDLAQDPSQGPSALADWALSQKELVLRGGQLRWTDDMRAAPPLVLSDVEAVLRNGGQHHRLRIDATPPAAWGDRFSLRASLREPFSLGFFKPRQMPWQNGSGELFAEFSRIDIAELRPFLGLLDQLTVGADLASGRGALRLWTDIKDGQFSAATADLALEGVRARLASHLQPLALASLSGRISGQRLATGFEVRSEDLRFETEDKLAWPGGKLSLVHTQAEGQQASRTELNADTLDLATLAALSARLPLSAALHSELLSLAPRGRVEQLTARWQGPAAQPQALSARGRVRGLSLAPGTADDTAQPGQSVPPGRPGVAQLDLDFELTPQGGQAKLAMADGAISLPGVLAQPRLPVTQLSGQMAWTLTPNAATKPEALAQADETAPSGGYLNRISQLRLTGLRFANADLAGRAELAWQPPAAGQSGPGLLDLQASLSRGRATAVHRYLPQILPLPVRQYLEGALRDGELADVKLTLKGDLQHFPFADPRQGDLELSARLRQVRLAYGATMAPPSTLPWPELEALDGELVIQRSRLEVRQLQGRATGLPGLQLLHGKVLIADLGAPLLDISFQAKGALAQGLQYVNRSPVSAMLGDALRQASATGPADYSMRLTLPLTGNDKMRLQASLVLPGNDLRLAPELPLLARARGTLNFTEDSLRLANAQARVLGGDLQFEGGQSAPTAGRTDSEPLLQFRGQGTLTAEGLRQAGEAGASAHLAPLAQIAQIGQVASGSAAYTVVLGVRRGEIEFKLNSPLTGLALDLPAPLKKSLTETLPLQIERSVRTAGLSGLDSRNGLQDQLSLTLGDKASVRYERALETSATQAGRVTTPRVLRGSLALGLPPGESVTLPAQGVAAKLQLAQADLDAWQNLLGLPLAASASASSAASAATPAPAFPLQPYLPTQLNLRAQSLSYQGYQLNDLALIATRDGMLWHTDIEARELSGYAEFGQGSTARGDRLYARLTRLNLAASMARDVEALLDPSGSSVKAASGRQGNPGRQAVPALDIVVDDFELRGRKLGRLEVDAVNRPLPARDGNPREWRLNRLLISSPEGVLTANGSWAVAVPAAPSVAANGREPRRMALDFRLDVADAGGLLKRLGMDGLVGRGAGKLAGELHWAGSPLALDYPSLSGQLNVNIERGQFLKADPGIAKLLGVLSLQSLPRRLALDFRDVFSEGFAFDLLSGDVRIDQGIASTRNLQMKGVNAAVMMEGSADIARETQQLQVLVIPEVNAGTVSLLASIANPVVGVGTFLAQMFLRGSLNSAATQAFTIDGAWTEPRITRLERRPEPARDKTQADKPDKPVKPTKP